MKANVVKSKTFTVADGDALDAAILAFLRTLNGEETFISLTPFSTPTGVGAQLLYTT